MLQKHIQGQSETGDVLKPLREFLLPTPAQLADHDPSKIYYMEILDENADCEETMAEVAGMLSESIRSESQDWVVLVGDGKTYYHLTKVKRLYGSALGNVLLFPGDWHVLKNFQPVLMKAYYHTGLKEIAKASGYRGETLTSLEKCSHFKCTHTFLIQEWEALYSEMISSFIATYPHFSDLKTDLQYQINSFSNKKIDVCLLFNV